MKAFEIKITKELKKDFAKAEKVNSTFQLYSSLPDPDKILADNNYDYSILRDLLDDPHLSAVVQQRKSFVQRLGLEIASEGNKESERKVYTKCSCLILADVSCLIYLLLKAYKLIKNKPMQRCYCWRG